MSPAFVALVKKERLSLLVFFVLAVSAGLVTILVEGFEYQFVLGGFDRFEELALVQCGLALLAGAWLGLREEATRTQEFLRQHPLAPEVPVLARGLAGALTAFLAPVAAGALALGHDRFFGGGGVGVRAESWSILAAVGAAVLATFSAGFAAASFPGSSFARGILLVLALATQLALQSWFGSLVGGLPWTLAVLAWGAWLLAWARCAAERGRDLDRPVSARLLGSPLAGVALASAVFGSLACAGWEKLAAEGLAATRPWIGWASDGRLVRCRWDRVPGSFAIVDEAGRPTGERIDDDQPRVAPPRHTIHAVGAFRWPHHVWWTAPPFGGELERRIAFDHTGVRAITRHTRTGERSEEWLLMAEEIGSAPDELTLCEVGDRGENTFALARGGKLWRLTEAGAFHVEEQSLPDGAVPTGTFHFLRDEGFEQGLETTLGNFVLESGAWRKADAIPGHPEVTTEWLDHDPLTPTQRFTGPGGVTLDVAHALDSTRKKLLAGWMGLSAVLRPLPLALVSATLDYEAVAEARPDEFLVLFDPLLGGGHAWLFVPNVLLHAWLLWVVARELARRGLDPARRRRWILAYLVAGIWIAAWCAALETRRAWKKSRSGPAPAPLVGAPRATTA